jgi:serine protease Do
MSLPNSASVRPRSLRAALLGAAAIVAIGGVALESLPQFSQAAIAATSASPAGPASFADVVDRVKGAVVSVKVKMSQDADASDEDSDMPHMPEFAPGSPMERFFKRFGQGQGGENGMPGMRPHHPHLSMAQGSGFFISADGYVVTNNHVVDHATDVTLTTVDGKTVSAKVIGKDAKTDLALLKVTEGGNYPFVNFATQSPRVGDWVIAVGNPFGLGGTVTAGIVSARGRDIGSGPYDDFIQIDAAVNRGNSGGPTFDVTGNVIGVNSAIISPSGGSVGIGFAIPADTVKSVVEQLREKGKVTRGWIGVEIQDVTPEIANDLGIRATRGALVAEPQTGGPAAKAGIESGDVITAINAKEIADSRDLAKTISAMPPGSSAKITALHAGQEKTFGIVLGSLPDAREAPESTIDVPKQHGTNVARLGLSVAPTAAGVVVTAIDPDGVAAEQGVTPGDVIVQAGGRRIASATDLRTVVEAAQKAGRHSVLMRVKSGDGTKFVTLPLARG